VRYCWVTGSVWISFQISRSTGISVTTAFLYHLTIATYENKGLNWNKILNVAYKSLWLYSIQPFLVLRVVFWILLVPLYSVYDERDIDIKTRQWGRIRLCEWMWYLNQNVSSQMFKTSQGERTIHAFSAIITFFEFVHCLRFENVWHLTYLFGWPFSW